MVEAHPPSPCKSICKLAKKVSTGEEFCLGCGRTRAEIKGWRLFTKEEKEVVVKRLGETYGYHWEPK